MPGRALLPPALGAGGDGAALRAAHAALPAPRGRKDYLGSNPLDTVPLLEDGAVRMTEFAAICQSRDPARPDAAERDARGAGVRGLLNELHLGEATLTFPQTLVLRYRALEPPERQQPQVADDYARWFLSRPRNGLMVLDGAPTPWSGSPRLT